VSQTLIPPVSCATSADPFLPCFFFFFFFFARRDIALATPFPLESEPVHFIHTTYLDSLGRPAIRINKKLCTEKCGEDLVYVRPLFSLPFSMRLSSPSLLTLAFFYFGHSPSCPQVKYTLTPLAHWQKTFAVSAVSMGLFGGVMALKRALGGAK
jgi:hypothetical protein